MSTILVIEDQFLASYDLECTFKDRGYDVRHTATPADALAQYRALRQRNELAAIVCDNRLIDDKPAAKLLYGAIRTRDAETLFIVYSGFPPDDLPGDDPRLAIVRKPFVDQVLARVEALGPSRSKGRTFPSPLRRREAA